MTKIEIMKKENYWMCIIGPADKSKLPQGADQPMRKAVDEAFIEITGHDYENMWSGWGLTEDVKDRVMDAWNKEPEFDFGFAYSPEMRSTESMHDLEVIADKTLRQNLDKQLQNLKDLSPSRERALAITKLQEAILWLGMDLKRLNEPNPYPNSYDPSNTKIEPTADNLKM